MLDIYTQSTQYLRGHSTPEVWIGCTGLKHWSNDCLIFFHELPEHIGIGEEVITICHLHKEEKINCKIRLWVVKEVRVAHQNLDQVSTKKMYQNRSWRLNREKKKQLTNYFQGRRLRQFPKMCSVKLLQFWMYFTSKLYPTEARQCRLGWGIQIENVNWAAF